jgi:hypothetical protein
VRVVARCSAIDHAVDAIDHAVDAIDHVISSIDSAVGASTIVLVKV